jgi:hypothetical protein
MTSDKALDLALEALEFFKGLALSIEEIERAEEAITAINQARSAPVQEPGPSGDYLSDFQEGQWWLAELDAAVANGTPAQRSAVAVVRNLLATVAVNTPQPAPVQEPVACKTLCELCVKRGYAFCANAAKTTPITVPPAKLAQHEPEHIVHSNGRYSPLLTHMMNKRVGSNVKQVIHLYDELPAAQRQWVGLTDEEIGSAYEDAAAKINYCAPSHVQISRAIEAKLKEKNT